MPTPSRVAAASCDELAALVSRVTVALLCDHATSSRIVDGVLDRLRSAGRPAVSIEDTRSFVARAAFDAALPFVDHTRPDPDASPGREDLPLAVLARLAPVTRVIVVLREVEAMSFEQIGEVVGMSPGSVATDLFVARRALRDALGSLQCIA